MRISCIINFLKLVLIFNFKISEYMHQGFWNSVNFRKITSHSSNSLENHQTWTWHFFWWCKVIFKFNFINLWNKKYHLQIIILHLFIIVYILNNDIFNYYIRLIFLQSFCIYTILYIYHLVNVILKKHICCLLSNYT